MSLIIIYRGLLTDCSFSCEYCPFSKTVNSPHERVRDREALERFVQWAEKTSDSDRPLEIFFTPFGEALTRSWYREAFVRLSNMPNIKKTAVQTNLSCSTEWLSDCCRETAALWATFHPDFVSAEAFARKCNDLFERGVKFSAGAVGMKQNFSAIADLRKKLPSSVYLWINAYKRDPHYYSENDIAFLSQIDPLFTNNLKQYDSEGRSCSAGESVISVEGNGDVYRCHFIREKRGSIFTDPLENLLRKESCTNKTCGCHIGYIYLEHLKMAEIYGSGMLERIPCSLSNFGGFDDTAAQ